MSNPRTVFIFELMSFLFPHYNILSIEGKHILIRSPNSIISIKWNKKQMIEKSSGTFWYFMTKNQGKFPIPNQNSLTPNAKLTIVYKPV